MANSPLGVAIIGSDGYAGYLRARIEELPDEWRLLAVTTLDPDGAGAKECKARQIAVYLSVEELLGAISPAICPVIVVASSINSHFDYAKDLITRGFNVMLEKPPVAVIQDLDELIRLQDENRKYISVNFQILYSTMIQQLKKRMEAGEFGNVLSVRALAMVSRPKSYFSRADWSGRINVGGEWVLDGIIGNPLAHLLANVLCLATLNPGMATPAQIEAELYHANDIEGEDTGCIRVHTADGVSVFFAGTLCYSGNNQIRATIEMERAAIILDGYGKAVISRSDGSPSEALGPFDSDQAVLSMLRYNADGFKRNIRPLVTVDQCRPFMLAWNGAYESFGPPQGICSAFCFDGTDEDGLEMRGIFEIERFVKYATDQGVLFSEMGVPWASPGMKIDLADYYTFPSKNRAFTRGFA